MELLNCEPSNDSKLFGTIRLYVLAGAAVDLYLPVGRVRRRPGAVDIRLNSGQWVTILHDGESPIQPNQKRTALAPVLESIPISEFVARPGGAIAGTLFTAAEAALMESLPVLTTGIHAQSPESRISAELSIRSVPVISLDVETERYNIVIPLKNSDGSLNRAIIRDCNNGTCEFDRLQLTETILEMTSSDVLCINSVKQPKIFTSAFQAAAKAHCQIVVVANGAPSWGTLRATLATYCPSVVVANYDEFCELVEVTPQGNEQSVSPVAVVQLLSDAASKGFGKTQLCTLGPNGVIATFEDGECWWARVSDKWASNVEEYFRQMYYKVNGMGDRLVGALSIEMINDVALVECRGEMLGRMIRRLLAAAGHTLAARAKDSINVTRL